MSSGPPDNRGPVLFLVMLVMAALLAVAWGLGDTGGSDDTPPYPPPSQGPTERQRPRTPKPSPQVSPLAPSTEASSARDAGLPSHP